MALVQLFLRLPAWRGGKGRGLVIHRVYHPTFRIDATDSGYALVDALVGLLIIAMGLIFSLEAGRQAHTAVDQALEVRRAQSLLIQLIETGPKSFTDSAGTTDSFSWQVETRATGGERPIQVCHRRVILTNVRTRRTYGAATLETCPIEAAG